MNRALLHLLVAATVSVPAAAMAQRALLRPPRRSAAALALETPDVRAERIQRMRQGDRWLGPDKPRHFAVTLALQVATYNMVRAAGGSRRAGLVSATITSAAASIGKELYDERRGGYVSVRDLTWDAAGIVAGTALIHLAHRN